MFVIVVTGGIGAGKSVAVERFRSRGAVVLDLDDIAARLLADDPVLTYRVREAFGESVFDAAGQLDRAALAHAAFATTEAAAELNRIVHPAVAREVIPSLTDLQLLPFPPQVVVIDVPLLVEAPIFAEVADSVLAIEAPVETRVTRAVSRGMAEHDVRRRIACQATDAERAALAKRTIVNDGSLEDFNRALDRYWDETAAGHAT